MSRVLPFLIFVIWLFASQVFGQAPQGFSYQAVACDANGSELVNQAIRVRASILKDGLNGTEQWIEIHAFDPTTTQPLKTDQFGLFTLVIGQGQAQPGGTANAFSAIDWGYGNLWLKIELDPAGGSNFTTIGAQRIFSVPFALFSEKAKASDTALDDKDRDEKNELQDLKFDPATGLLTLVPLGQGGSVTITPADPSADNELQGLVYDAAANTISVFPPPSGGSGSGSALISLSDGDRDATNELQELKWDAATSTLSVVPKGQGGAATLSIPGAKDQDLAYDATANTLTLSPGGTPVSISDGDRDATNELQELKWDAATSTLSVVPKGQGGSATLSIPGAKDQDLAYDATANTLTLSPGGTPVSISDGDRDPANEIQELKWNATTKTLSIVPAGQGSANMNLPVDLSETNELQSLTYDAATNSISISPSQSGLVQTIALSDSDRDPTNELQGLSFDPSTRQLSISPAPSGQPATVVLNDLVQQLTYDTLTNELKLAPAPIGANGTSTVKLNSISFGDPGADVVYPNGLKGEYKVVSKNFLVPQGKTFYVTAGSSTVKFKHPTYTGGTEVTGYTAPSQPIFPPGTLITQCYCTGFLTEDDPFLNTMIIDLNSGAYQVPIDKVLYIKSGMPTDKSWLSISTDGGASYDFYDLGTAPFEAATRIITIPGGSKIAKNSLFSGTEYWLTGYLLRL